MTKEELFQVIVDSGKSGLTYPRLKVKFGAKGWWNFLEELQKEKKVFGYKIKGERYNHYTATEFKEEQRFATLAKCGADRVASEVIPLVKEMCIKEFGMLPVVHQVCVAENPSVTVKGNLPACFDSVVAYAVNGCPVMLTGAAGTGKGYLARQVAKSLGAEFFEVNAVKNSYDLTGFVDAQSRFVKTPFYDACKAVSEGKKAVFLFDEMDCSDPEVLKIFNEAMSSFEFTFPNDEKLEFENLVIIAACNTFGTGADEQYCGEQLDASTLDRFAMVRVEYEKSIELSITGNNKELVKFFDTFRAQTEKNGLPFVVSYRSLKRIAKMEQVLPLAQVMKECFLKSIADDDLRSILSAMPKSMENNRYYKAALGENVETEQSQELQFSESATA